MPLVRSFSMAYRKCIARVALFALLFSSLSPAMAALLFADRPEILRRVLALPAPVTVDAAVHDDGCPHESAQGAHHGTASPDSHGKDEHAQHGIYCSFCLTAGSVVALAGHAGAPVWLEAASGAMLFAVSVQPPLAIPIHGFHPRGPPRAIR